MEVVMGTVTITDGESMHLNDSLKIKLLIKD
jgi:hypothetical protein